MTSINLTEDEFNSKFQPIDHNFDLRCPLISHIPGNHIWTAVDGDDGKIYLLSGRHVVNRIYYVVTQLPRNPQQSYEVKFDDLED